MRALTQGGIRLSSYPVADDHPSVPPCRYEVPPTSTSNALVSDEKRCASSAAAWEGAEVLVDLYPEPAEGGAPGP